MRRFALAAGITAALITGVGPAAARPKAPPEPPLQVSYPTDGALACDQLVAEMARMDAIMGVSTAGIQSAQAGAQAAELGASVGINAALYSGALGQVPGLGLFANGASMFARNRAAAKQQSETQKIQTAQTRRALLGGMHQGKGCGLTQAAAAPVAAMPATVPATPDPAPAPVATATPVAAN